MTTPDAQESPRLHPDEISLGAQQVTELLRQQAGPWAGLEPTLVRSSGADNWLFRLGTELVFRGPRRSHAAGQIAKEQAWLQRLAPDLPLPIPKPLFQGRPTEAFPYPWSVLPWIEGRTAERREFADSKPIALQLANFLRALQSLDATDGPAPGAHNSGRGEPLVHRDEYLRSCTQELEAGFDRGHILDVWDQALAAPVHAGPPKWLHGDLLPSNLLLDEAGLAAVIDFGLLGAGDPACDLIPAWALFDGDARATFREALQPDDATWARGRGWALSFAVIALPYYRPLNHPLADVAAETLTAVLEQA